MLSLLRECSFLLCVFLNAACVLNFVRYEKRDGAETASAKSEALGFD